MTNEEKMKSIYFWQNVGVVHPLTCPNCEGHKRLAPLLINKRDIVLTCTSCEYLQEHIPGGLFKYVEKATTKKWEATDGDVKMEVIVSFLKEEITCKREKSIFGGDLQATLTFVDFKNKEGDYDLHTLIKDFFGTKILSQVKKIVKCFEKRRIMYSKLLSEKELEKVLY